MGIKVAIGSDHRGFEIKKALISLLEFLGNEAQDMGPFLDASADYPEFASKVASEVENKSCDRGVLICGSGIGMSIAANKFKGVRATLCHDLHTAEMCRRHNNSNLLVLGEALGAELSLVMLKVWLSTPFEGGRHQDRLDLINEIEKKNFK
jgi:ribose 5-phosphate isomerase B